MNTLKKFYSNILLLAFVAAFLSSCIDDVDTDNDVTEAKYFVGIEHGIDGTDVLSSTASLDTGVISPINNGFEQLGWASYIQGEDQIFSIVGTTLTSYELEEEVLIEGASLTTDLAIYASDVVDESTMVAVASPWFSIGTKKIYLIDTDAMGITSTVETSLGDIEGGDISFPSDAKVIGDQLFISYYMYSLTETLPDMNEARVAVYSYPELEFESIITDDRAPNIGRYYTQHALALDENDDLYTVSTSSVSCGYQPAPETNSGILRIKSGEISFDDSYHIDFETISGGYKINDIYYVSNGKAVVRILKEDETAINAEGGLLYGWAAYSPYSTAPILEFGVIDLYTQEFTLVTGAPSGGGGWTSSVLVEDDNVYVGISNSTYSGIYVIDPTTAVATEAADIDGNYAKAILTL